MLSDHLPAAQNCIALVVFAILAGGLCFCLGMSEITLFFVRKDPLYKKLKSMDWQYSETKVCGKSDYTLTTKEGTAPCVTLRVRPDIFSSGRPFFSLSIDGAEFPEAEEALLTAVFTEVIARLKAKETENRKIILSQFVKEQAR